LFTQRQTDGQKDKPTTRDK